MRGNIFAAKFLEASAAVGLTPDNCTGLAWIKGKTDADPNVTFEALADDLDARIAAGTATHGWYLSGLQLSWDDMLESERIRCIQGLAAGGALKAILHSMFTKKFTPREAREIDRLLRNGGSGPAADRLKRSAPKRVVGGSYG